MLVLLLLIALMGTSEAQEAGESMSLEMLPDGYLVGVPTDSLVIGFLCPMHPKVTAEKEGEICYICGMALVDGTIKMPHASHDPHYGGIFFMARDTWHHVEGAMPAPGVFRFHLFDNYSIPMTTMHASGRVIFQEFRDENGNQARPPIEAPLLEAPDGVSFMVSDRRFQLERDFHVLMRFEADQTDEDRFDFAFYEYTSPTQGDTQAEFEPDKDFTASLVIPETQIDIVEAMLTRMNDLDTLISRSKLNEIFLPALEVKDLALALSDNPGTLDDSQITTLRISVKSIVKAAWLLDTSGDFGDKPESESHFRVLNKNVAAIEALYR
jgi:hypothetical protein